MKKIILTVITVGLAGMMFSFALAYFELLPKTRSEQYVVFCQSGTCHPKDLPYQDHALSFDERTDDLLSRMTTTEKIGQLALVEKNSIHNPEDIARYGLGALLSGAGAKPESNTAEGWFQMVKDFQEQATKTRLSIPLFYGVDAIHGHTNVPGATVFPHAIGLGASKDADLVRDIAYATAKEAAATGVNWVYSPNVDIAQDMRWGRVYETFGSDPSNVSTLGKASVEGIQSFDNEGLKVAATAKHYLGNGATEWGSSTNKDFKIDQGNVTLSDIALRQTQLTPFRAAIEANAQSIMVGLNQWNGEKVIFNKYLLTDVLRNELGFKGFVVSDWYGVYENETDNYQALVKAINAGVDMVMLPFDYKTFSNDMQRALKNGDISKERLDEATRRILKAKFETGLFDGVLLEQASDIGTIEHRALAQKAVSESLVSLKNNKVVPISKKTPKIFVAGSAANNIGMQSGAWTVEWQGIDGNWIPGTTILKGIQDKVSSSTKVEYSLVADFAESCGLADIVIAVIGERPYAEGWGDIESPTLSSEDLMTIAKLKRVSKKVVVVIVSGRPLNIKDFVKDWDAVIAAWLPGSEGQGVADVLFGDKPFVGVLPIIWDL
ncbi:MAG: glycoside hydrolase family 3 protein [Candidatus Magasanikbacteria bacterium]|nr:glycoside hydrolase family 3 protein [Candidatus Magasanikbacteria bacterium]